MEKLELKLFVKNHEAKKYAINLVEVKNIVAVGLSLDRKNNVNLDSIINRSGEISGVPIEILQKARL